MTTYHQIDPDVLRWGLHLIDVCSLSNDGSPETITCYERDYSEMEPVMEGFCNPTRSFVENDEIIAQTLQEEHLRLADSDVSEFSKSYDGKQHLKKYTFVDQDWLCPPGSHSNSGFQCNQEEENKESVLPNIEELSLDSVYQSSLPEIEDESHIDGELGKRLNHMVPVPHAPKINGDIPSADEATSDHRRLLDRLQMYELSELKILGDGNCQFRSLSDQIYRTPEHHKFVREQIVSQLESQPDLYGNYVPMAYGDYLKKIRKSGEWGDHVTLQAAADCYGVKIFVITSFKDTCYIEILPQTEKSKRIIFLSFWAEVHYNSIYPLGELPVVEGQKKKRRWWS